MKEIIDISEETYALIKNNELLSNSSYKTEIWEAINNGIPFFQNATNGDMIKNLYPYILTTEDNLTGQDVVVIQANGTIMVCLKDWWDAPYKAESEDKE